MVERVVTTRRAATRIRRAVGAALVGILAIGALTACDWPRRLFAGGVEEIFETSFYLSPTPAPSGQPGEILRSQPIESAPDGVDAYRVVYHSTDLNGKDILVSGVVAVPEGPAPEGGRTVVAWGHPTTGIAPRCAPSVGIDPFDLIEGFSELIARGYAVAYTDYSGMGMAGESAYLIGSTEGRNVLDSVRAARQLDIGASDRVALWGHSQGGQAVLFAAQLAADYAPELDVEAVAVAAPAVDLGGLLDADIDDISGVTISAYAFDVFVDVYGSTPGVSLETILVPAAVDVVPRMAQLCLLGQNAALHELGAPFIDGAFLIADPATTEPWASLLKENTPGGVRLDMPLFVAQGASDTLVRPELTARFVAEQQGLGTDVTSIVIADTGHGLVALRALPELLPWLDAHAPAAR